MASTEPGKLNLLDRVIQTVSPVHGLRRAVAREKLSEFGWDGTRATTSRGSSGGMWKNAAAASPRMEGDRLKLMWDARDLERQFGFMKGMLARTVDYTVHRLSYKARTGDEGINKLYEDYFHDWCGRSDYTGRFRFIQQVRLALRSMLRDGDFGFVKHYDGGELRLQGIEADRIGDPNQVTTVDEKKVSGINLGERGEPVSYEIFKRGRVITQYTVEAEIPAGGFVHLWNPFRYDQYRGVSWFDSSLPSMRDLYECMAFEKSAAKYASSFAGFIGTDNPYGADGAAAWDTAATSTTPAMMKAREGTVVRLANGEKFTPAPPTTRPSGAFLTLIEVLLREIANGLNLPFGFVYDMARFGGVTARLETQQAQRVFQVFQRMLVDMLLDEVKNSVLRGGIASGRLPAHPKWKSGSWMFGAWLTADIGHEVSADIEMLNAGLTSESRLIEKYGDDADEIRHEQGSDIQSRVRVTQITGTPIELQCARLPSATQLLAAHNVGQEGGEGTPIEEEQPQGPPPGLVGEQGEKGVKPLIEILKAVSVGKMDRESAIQAIMRLYALPRLDAEQMVPAVATPQQGAGRKEQGE